MKFKILIIFILLFVIKKSFSQIDTNLYEIRRDTILVVDTIIKGDTILINKHYKVRVYLKKKKKKDTLKEYKPHVLPDVSFMSPNTSSIKPKFKPNLTFNLTFLVSPSLLMKYPKVDTFLLPHRNQNFYLLPSVSWKNYAFGTGLGFSFYREMLNFNFLQILYDTSYSTSIFQHQIAVYDTTWYIDLDSLVNGDTVWRYYVDTSYTTVYDTITVQNVDTTKKIYKYKSRNLYKRFDIPIFLSYNFDYQRFTFTPTLGVIFSILYYEKGKYVDENFNKAFVFRRLDLFFYTGFYASYKINDHFSLFLGGFSKFSYPYFYSYNEKRINFYSFGLSFGFNIKF